MKIIINKGEGTNEKQEKSNGKKATITVILAGVVLIIAGIVIYTCYHRWNNATCTEPRTCSICGKTEGEPLGHKWNSATCVKPQICKVCKETKEYTIELTNSQKNAVIRAYEEENFWHVSRDYLIYDVLVGFDYFSVEDATFAVDHMEVDFDEQAVLFVKENSSGQSRGGIVEMMRYYGYTEEQINNALEQTGF